MSKQTETLREMKVLVGYKDTNEGTLKYLIHKDLGKGLYLAERFTLVQKPDGSQYLASGKVGKVHLKNIQEEEIKGG